MSNPEPSHSLPIGHHLFPVLLANLGKLQSSLHGPLNLGRDVYNLNHKERNCHYILTGLSSSVSLQSFVQ